MKRVIAALIICLLLTGCWDQVQLKKMLFADIIGLDYEGDGKQLKVSFVISSLRNVHQGGGIANNLYLESKGKNIYHAVDNTNKEMPGVLAALETRLFLLSTRFAKDQPLNYLDITSQFRTNPLYGYLAVYDGDLSKLLATKKFKEDLTAADFLVGLLEDEHKRGTIPSNQLLDYILGGGRFLNDFALNRFEPYENGARLAGTALFKDGKYTGVNLNNEDTQLAVLMNGAVGRSQPLVGNIGGKRYTTLVKEVKNDVHIISSDDGLSEINLSLKLDLKLIEDGHKVKKHTNTMLTELEKKITDDLTAKISNMIATLQKANCDIFQLGHEVAAYHPKLFKGKDWWREQYPKINIKPIVRVRILNSGVLD
ncbi:Ger(x)C family spore germination protein [Paenibacillus roseipurpureus]|uniref:Ger(X)C family spore germination protein n=1 Tax=Paenibacillus roseopurpureus TaxID=2918901 RepID=A0AA96LKQ5_9BACL|nr:Ger(x)C family spore germination protein [Paenibacillus sp. MBLB1832]WNR42734.1 Ger(x)C family spore germination protein [Paenibacillus sp. MBLB1832]